MKTIDSKDPVSRLREKRNGFTRPNFALETIRLVAPRLPMDQDEQPVEGFDRRIKAYSRASNHSAILRSMVDDRADLRATVLGDHELGLGERRGLKPESN